MSPPAVPDAPSAIYWTRTAAVHPDAGYGPDVFMAFDPAVRFPRFHMKTGDEAIGNVRLIKGGPESGHWEWSMRVSLSGPRYSHPTNGTEASRGATGRRVVEVYRHYLSTRPKQYPPCRTTSAPRSVTISCCTGATRSGGWRASTA